MREGRPILLLGPCSAESVAKVLLTCSCIQAFAPHAVFRAGLWKPRTSPHAFAGVGEEGIAWLVQVQKEYGMPVATEVVTPEHVQLCVEAGIHHLWIGARTTSNPILVQSLADTLQAINNPAITLYIKNPINPDIDLWIGAIERFRKAGVTNIVAIHRGFSTLYKGEWRNAPMWSIPIETMSRCPDVPMLCDPSHIAGTTQGVEQLAAEAMKIGFDGLMIECHHDPSTALSDANQQLTPEQLQRLLEKLPTYTPHAIPDTTLVQLRKQIDEIDDEIWQLVARRLEVVEAIGEHKKATQMPILQTDRYDDIVQKRIAWAKENGLSEELVRTLMESLHTESVKRQL